MIPRPALRLREREAAKAAAPAEPAEPVALPESAALLEPAVLPEPQPADTERDELTAPAAAVRDSMSVAVWTIISRVTGVLRGITIAAVLGATYFANTFQFTNSLPNLIFYGLLAGSLFSSLLVPALVRHIDAGDSRSAAKVAGGLMGVALAATLLVVPAAAVLTPLLLKLGTLGTASSAAHGQAAAGAILVLLLLPQVPLYAFIGTSTAVMNAHRKFALAAAAPALENLGTIAVLGFVWIEYSRAAQQGSTPLSLLILLGAGTTAAVALHACVQWWGARRVGVTLRPRAGWRDPLVRAVIRRALPAAGQAALVALQLLALLVVADRIAGGDVAVQLALNFYFLPIAVGATPVALSLVPRLARMTKPGQGRQFRDTYVRGLAFAAFLIVPAATAYAVLARPLAAAIAYGRFGTAGSVELVEAALTGLAVGIIGETLFMVATYACYARHDTTHPLRGMLIQTGVCAAGILLSLQAHGAALLTGLGLSMAAGSLCAAAYLLAHLRRTLPRGGESPVPAVLRALAASALMAPGAWATARLINAALRAPGGHLIAMLAATAVGAGIYLAVQAALRAPELAWIGAAARGRVPRLRSRLAMTLDLARKHGAIRPSWLPAGLRRKPAQITAWLGGQPRLRLDVILLMACAAFGGLAAVSLKYALIGLVVAGLSGWVLAKPQVAAYLLILLTPLIVGVNAGVPLVRPNEALIVLFGVLIAVRWVAGLRTGERRWPKLDRVDISLIALGLTSSLLPLLMMVARQRPITSDDLLYCIVIWKLLAEYVIVRSTITTREQAMKCLWLSMIAGAVVCVIGILQSLNLLGVPALLARFYAPLGEASAVSIGRGSSLLSLPAAVADLAILNLGIAIAMLARAHKGGRKWLAGLAIVFVLGVVAAAEFSTVIGLIIALGVLVVLTGYKRLLVYAIPVAIAGAIALWPVIQMRLTGFHSASGIPVSWETRLTNLRTYFWPQLFTGNNWILGVRPSARVAVPTQLYGFVWIESGYTWLLWAGGLPLLGSYLAFAGYAIRKGCALAKRQGPAAIAGTAIAAALAAQVVLMLFDPHLTYRGSGDALFLILALARIIPARRAARHPAAAPATAAVPATAPGRQEVPA